MYNLESILKVGKVISVKGRYVEVLVDKSKNSSHLLFYGKVLKNVSVGSYVKIAKGFEILIGKIDGEYIFEEKGFEKKDYIHEKDRIRRILNISLLGYFIDKVFKQGIKELPLLENECYLLTQDEFNNVHNFLKVINGKQDIPIILGNLANETGKQISVGINSLFASHIGVFGNTGSGKSYTLASLYHNLFRQYQCKEGFKTNAKFLFFDFNGEYSIENCIIEKKKIVNLSTRKEKISDEDKLPFSEDVLIDVELISILANATEKTQKPFISRALEFYIKVNKSKRPLDYFRNIVKKKIISILKMSDKDKAHLLLDYMKLIVVEQIEDVLLTKDIEWNNKNNHFMPRNGPCRELTESEIKETGIYKKAMSYKFPEDILSKIIHFLYLQLIIDVYNDKAKNDHIGPAINKLKSKINSLKKVLNTNQDSKSLWSTNNIVIINLNDVNIEIKKTIPLLLSKKIYSDHKLINKKNEKYLNIIIDEAHNILSYDSQRESDTWKDYRLETFEEIIKEGRKFGVFLTIASQRPSDISSTIISQLHNYFLHRLINNRDIDAIERTISYLDKVSFDALPILPTGSCILAGLSAQVPIIIEINSIENKYEPFNKTVKPTDYWE